MAAASVVAHSEGSSKDSRQRAWGQHQVGQGFHHVVADAGRNPGLEPLQEQE